MIYDKKHLSVTHYMRRPFINFYSIERVYEDVRTALPDDIEVTTVVSSYYSKGFLSRLRGSLEA